VFWLFVVVCGAAFYRLYLNAQQLTTAVSYQDLLCSLAHRSDTAVSSSRPRKNVPMHSVAMRANVPYDAFHIAVQMGGDRELMFRLLCSPHGLAILAAGHAAHVDTTNLRLALMDRWVGYRV
jgi:hypothetical protein